MPNPEARRVFNSHLLTDSVHKHTHTSKHIVHIHHVCPQTAYMHIYLQEMQFFSLSYSFLLLLLLLKMHTHQSEIRILPQKESEQVEEMYFRQ